MRNATKQIGITVAVLGMMAGMAGQARAGLLGDSVDAQYLYPTQGSVFTDLGTNAVAPTAVFNSFGQTQYTVSDTQIAITNTEGTPVNFTPATFNGVSFADVTRDPGITGVTIDPSTNLAGFDASRISFTSNEVFVNLQNLTTDPSTLVLLDLNFGTAVPEPSGLVLGGIGGLVGLGWTWRHRKGRRVA